MEKKLVLIFIVTVFFITICSQSSNGYAEDEDVDSLIESLQLALKTQGALTKGYDTLHDIDETPLEAKTVQKNRRVKKWAGGFRGGSGLTMMRLRNNKELFPTSR